MLFIPTASLWSQDQPDLSLLSGSEIYTSFCSRCHALDGSGEIPQELIDGMEVPPPDLREPYFSSREKRSDWAAVVTHGGPVRGLSMSMPAWGEVLSEKQVDEVVEHMKTFVDQSLYPQGETNFFRAHRVTKAFVEQEALIIPSLTRAHGITEFEATLYYADRFGNRFQYEVKLPAVMKQLPRTSFRGLGDLELGLKYCFYDDYRSKQIVSAGVEASLPTGNETLDLSGGSVGLTLFLAGGKQFGDLLQAQASVKFQSSIPRPLDRTTVIRSALSLTALFSDSKQGFFPGIEAEHVYERLTGDSRVFLLPKLYWGITAKGHIAVSIAPELQVSGPKAFDTRWRAFVLWDYVDGGIWW